MRPCSINCSAAIVVNAGASEQFRFREQVLMMPVAAHGDDVRVLDEQQMIRALVLFALRGDLMLNFKRLGVAHVPQIADDQITH